MERAYASEFSASVCSAPGDLRRKADRGTREPAVIVADLFNGLGDLSRIADRGTREQCVFVADDSGCGR